MARVRWQAGACTLLAVVLVATGCGGDDDGDDVAAVTTTSAVESPGDGGSDDGDDTGDDVNDTSDGGSAGSSSEVPDHLPVDLAPGGEVDAVAPPTEGSLQDYWYVRVLYPEDAAEDVVAFYDEQLAELGFLDQKLSSEPGNARWLTTEESGIVTMKVETGQTHFAGMAVLEIGWNET